MVDGAIIGCGVTGAAVAYHLAKKQVSVLILEAENDVSMGPTKANSAILPAGYDPEPGTRMAALNVRGSAMARKSAPRWMCPTSRLAALWWPSAPSRRKPCSGCMKTAPPTGCRGWSF